MFETPCSQNTLSHTSVFLSIPHEGNGSSVGKDCINAVRGAVHPVPAGGPWPTGPACRLSEGLLTNRVWSVQPVWSSLGVHFTGRGSFIQSLMPPPCLLRAWGLHQVCIPPPEHPLLQRQCCWNKVFPSSLGREGQQVRSCLWTIPGPPLHVLRWP